MITGYDIYKYFNLKSTDHLYGVYVGVQEIRKIYAPIKIGRCSNPHALQRGRSQGGANWWFITYYLLDNNDQTWEVERALKPALKEYSIKALQRQRELYSLTPQQAAFYIESTLIQLSLPVQNIVDLMSS